MVKKKRSIWIPILALVVLLLMYKCGGMVYGEVSDRVVEGHGTRGSPSHVHPEAATRGQIISRATPGNNVPGVDLWTLRAN